MSPLSVAARKGRASCRVDLAGGTLDIWPLGLLHEGGRTVNVALDLTASVELSGAARCSVRQGEDRVEAGSWSELQSDPSVALIALLAIELGLPPMTVSISSDSPRGGGLGASSAVGAALVVAGEAALGTASSVERRANLIRDVEARLMSLPTGKQDQYAALLGGVLDIRYRAGGEMVEALEVDLEALGRSLVVAYSGQSHFSAGKNWQVVRRRLDGDEESVRLFDGIAAAASRVARGLRTGDLESVGRAMSEEWSFRRRLAEGVSTPVIDRLLEGAADAGAWGGKATGAGGGGCVAVLCPGERRAEVERALEEAGGKLLPAAPSSLPAAASRVES